MPSIQESQPRTDTVIEGEQQQIDEELRKRAASHLPITQDYLDKLHLICSQRLRNAYSRKLAKAKVAMLDAEREAELTSSTVVSPSLRKEAVSDV